MVCCVAEVGGKGGRGLLDVIVEGLKVSSSAPLRLVIGTKRLSAYWSARRAEQVLDSRSPRAQR